MATKFLDYTGLAYLWQKIKAYFTVLLALKADDANVVHKAGVETVFGLKTFSGEIPTSTTSVTHGLEIRDPSTDRDQTYSVNHISQILFCDANGNYYGGVNDHHRLGLLQFNKSSIDNHIMQLGVYKSNNNVIDYSGLSVGITNTNIKYATAPSTPNRNVDTDIITRDWIPKDDRIVHKTSNETIDGIKTFNESINGNITGNAATATKLGISNVGASNNPIYLNAGVPTATSNILAKAIQVSIGAGSYSDMLQTLQSDNNNYRSCTIRCENGNGYNEMTLGVHNESNGAPGGITIRSTNGAITAIGPQPATDANDERLATTKWVNDKGYLTTHQSLSSYVTLNTIQSFTASKYFEDGEDIKYKINWTRSDTITNNTQKQVVPAIVQDSNGDELGALLWTRANFSGTFNYAALRVRSKDGDWADLSITVRDDNEYYCSLSNSSTNLKNTGFHGNLVGEVQSKVALEDYKDSICGFYSESNYRVGAVRIMRDSATKQSIILGVCSTSNGAPGGLVVLWENNQRIAFSSNSFLPGTDNAHYLGDSSHRWKQIYATTTTIATSDIRCKDYIDYLSNDFLDVWENIEWKQFKFKDAISEKGIDKARVHTGLIAQEIKSIFENNGLHADKYAFFCYDEWDDSEATLNEDGEELVQGFKAGNRYSLRYEEVLCIEAAYQRRKNKILESRISELETQVQNMLQVLESLKGA